MKYLPTTFPHTHTLSLNPPSHYKLKSYFYFLSSSLSLHLNYVSLAEKNFNLSYSPKILAYIFFFPSVRPRVTLYSLFTAEAEAEKTETRGNIQKYNTLFSRNTCYLQNIVPKNFSQPKPKQTDITRHSITIQMLPLFSPQFPFFCLFL